jgi:hypothetical protein
MRAAMRRSGIVTLFLGLLAIGAAELLYAFHTEHIAYDAGHYAGFAAEIARNGLFGYHLSIGSLFIYVTDLHPWYRWPAAVLNYVFLGLAAGGSAYVLGRFAEWPRHRWLAFVSMLVVGAGYTVVHAPTAVESRYGLLIDLLLTPFAVLAVARIMETVRERQRVLVWAFLLASFVATAACVSDWLQRQAPVLVAARAS